MNGRAAAINMEDLSMATSEQPLYERALVDPKAAFQRPQAVLDEKSLTAHQKRKILKQWELDARLIQVAEEEAMTSTSNGLVREEHSMLRDVRLALQQIAGPADEQPATPTKLGGAAQ
ncbi:MAG: hypothetical protein IT562_16495 [Alphaproteobacteria bacterium]|nr:hypothetical protein [Alphaproteobacteria bacterium]